MRGLQACAVDFEGLRGCRGGFFAEDFCRALVLDLRRRLLILLLLLLWRWSRLRSRRIPTRTPRAASIIPHTRLISLCSRQPIHRWSITVFLCLARRPGFRLHAGGIARGEGLRRTVFERGDGGPRGVCVAIWSGAEFAWDYWLFVLLWVGAAGEGGRGTGEGLGLCWLRVWLLLILLLLLLLRRIFNLRLPPRCLQRFLSSRLRSIPSTMFGRRGELVGVD